MKNIIFYPLVLSLLLIFFNANAQTYIRPKPNDTIRNMIDSIMQAKYRVDSLNVYAQIEAPDMSERWYSLIRFDSTSGALFWANSLTGKGKNHYLTNYYFYNDRLIGTSTSKTPKNNASSDKYINWERNCTYWNDSLIYSFTTNKETFDYKDELKTGYEILKRFKFLFTNRTLFFAKGTNMGKFQ